MSVQFLPEYFTRRGPSKSEQIMQQLEPVGKALGASLQNTIQGFYDTQKKSKAADAFASLPQYKSTPGIKDILMGTEPQQWEPLLKNIRSSSISGMNMNGDVSQLLAQAKGRTGGFGSSITSPTPVATASTPPPQQEKPTPASTMANLAAMQRAGNVAPYAPGTPEAAMAAQGMPMDLSQQPGSLPQQQQPPPEDQGPKKPLLASDLSPEENELVRNTLSDDAKEAWDKTRKSQIQDKANQAKIENAGLNRERFEWEKKKDERNYERAKEEATDKKTEKKIEDDEAETKPLRDHIREIRDTLNVRKQNITTKKEAIQKGDIGPFSRSHIANMFGHPELASQEATLMSATIKNLLVENLSALSARAPNMFLEQKFIEALGQVGSPKANNLSVTDMAKFNIDLDEAKVRTYDEVANKYENDPKIGYFSRDAEREYNRLVEKRALDLSKQLSMNLQEDLEYESSEQDLTALEKNPLPTPLTEKRKDAIATVAFEAIERKTGRIPTEQEVEQYSKTLAKRYNYILEK